MITTKTKGSKKYVSSSFFDDIRILKQSRYDTDYRDLYRSKSMDVGKLQLAYVIQEIVLWRKGCAELSEWTTRQNKNQLEDVYTVYVGKDDVEETIEEAVTETFVPQDEVI